MDNVQKLLSNPNLKYYAVLPDKDTAIVSNLVLVGDRAAVDFFSFRTDKQYIKAAFKVVHVNSWDMFVYDEVCEMLYGT